MNDIIAFSLITVLGVLPIALLLSKIILKNSIAFYNTSVFIISFVFLGNIIHIISKINYDYILLLILLSVLVVLGISYFFYFRINKPINNILFYLENLSKGVVVKNTNAMDKSFIEFEKISKTIERLNFNLKSYLQFVSDIKENKLESAVLDVSENDFLAHSLMEMKENLIIVKQEEDKRKAEDDIRTWNNIGVNKIVETLRHNNKNLFDLSFEVLSDIISYLDANVGGLFIIENDENGQYLDLIASYAYDRRKFLKKRVEIKEGLLGSCALEQKTIYLSKVPEDYLNISTGLGEGEPRAILIVPLKIDEEIIGVMELATFNELEKYKISFVENISENIASMLLNLKRQKETDILHEENKKQSELISQLKEETQMYFDELQDVQGEIEELENKVVDKNKEIEELKKKINL